MKISTLGINYKKSAIACLVMLCCLVMKSEVSFGQTVVLNPASPWIVPAGVSTIKVEVWGGGGAGGGADATVFGLGNNRGSSGGGGAYNVANWLVSVGQSYSITIGTGGTGSSGNDGPNGTATIVTGLAGTVTGNPGTGGKQNGGTAGTGGTGTFNGGAGAVGGTNAGNGPGGGGGGGNNGPGSAGTIAAAGAGGVGNPNIVPYIGGSGGGFQNANANGKNGTSPGGGGGGGRSVNSTTTYAGGNGGAGQVVITYYIAPTISGFSPASACAGSTQSVVITGTNFTGATAVQFGATTAAYIVNSATQITATMPIGLVAGNYAISVTTPGGTVTSGTNFTVNPNATLSLTSANNIQTTCINNAISNITYTIGGGATNANASGLPAGVTGTLSGTTFTISGTPSVSGTYNYTVNTTGTCTQTSATGTITVNPNSTITLSSAAGTDNQTKCVNNAITNITYAIGNATGATLTGTLPTGVTGVYNSGVFTISGTPSVTGTYNYTVTTSGGCTAPSLNGTITVNDNGTIALTSGNNNQTFCLSSPASFTPITYSIGGNATGAGATGLPPGISGSYSGGTFTISGTASASGLYNYTVTTTGSPCSNPSLTGTITVNDDATISLTSATGTDNQTICGGNPLNNITYAIGGFGTTGATVTGLPSGITGSYNSGTFTISGTSIIVGTYNYTVTTTGSCINNSLGGTITINTSGTVIRTSAAGTDAQTVCINNAITNITYAIGGDATGASITAGALPAGVTGSYNGLSGEFTITGTPTTSGTFNYTVSASGSSCADLSASGTITVNDDATISLSSAPGTDNQTKCISTAITPVTYAIGGGGTGASITAGALPAGVTGLYNAGVFTISGTPGVSGTFSYTVTTTGPCVNTFLSGTISVQANSTITLTSGTASPTSCINTPITTVTYTVGGSGTGASLTSGSFPAGVTGTFSGGIFTISGTPTVSGSFPYTITTSGPCANASLSGTITVNADATISLSSAPGTDNQTKCVSTAITPVTYAIGGGGTGASITAGALPAGVTGTYNSGTKVFTISGTPGVSGTFNYTVTTTGPCVNTFLSGTINVQANSTITLTSGTASLTSCINTPITTVSYTVGGGGTGASLTSGSFPAGVTGTFSGGIFTISGTPTVSGTFPYTITTSGPCVNVSASGTITVQANSTISLSSAPGTDNQTKCVSTAITPVTYAIGGGGTGASITAGALPAGVNGTYNPGTKVFTISGTPSVPGTFSYTVTTTGPCVNTFLSGTINVQANSTITLTTGTASQTSCINTPITTVTYTVGGGGTGASLTSGSFPAGVTGTFSGGIFTISGTPTVSGSFPYTITTSGPCTNVSASGTITINVIGSWLGGTSNNWFTASNWGCGVIPTATTDVIIPASGVTFQPTIGAGGTAVCRNITNNGTLTITNAGANTLDVYGDWTNNGTFTFNTSSVTFRGSSNNTLAGSNATTFYNLTVNKGATANTLTSSAKAFTVNNDLTVTQGNLILTATDVSYSVKNINVPAAGILTDNVNWDGVHLLSVTGNIAIDGIFNYTSGTPHVNMNGGGNKTVRSGTNPASGFGFLTLSTGNYTADGQLVVNSNFWAMFGTTGNFYTNGQNITAKAAIIINGGTTNINGGTLNVTGGMNVGWPGGAAGSAGPTGNVIFSSGTLNTDGITVGAAATLTPSNATAGTFTQSGTSTVNLSGNLVINNVSGTNYTCTTGSPIVNIQGNWTNNLTFTCGTTSQVNFNGTTAQAIGGTVATTFNNLSIANAAGVTLSNSPTVNGTLNLSNGLINTGANVITVIAAGNITGGSNTSYVNGRLARGFAAGAGSKIFPIGKGGNYRPLNFTYTASIAVSTITVEQFESAILPPGSVTPATVTPDIRYWSVTKTGTGTVSYTVTLDPTYTPSPAGSIVYIIKKEGTSTALTATQATTPNYTNTPAYTTFAGSTTASGTNSFALGYDCSSAANAGTQLAAICTDGTTAPLGGSILGTATGGTWSSSVGGTFNPDANTLNATWTPPAGYSGTASLTLTPTGGLCSPNTVSSKNQVVNPLPTITPNAGGATPVCFNPLAQTTILTYTATNVPTTYSITWNGTPTNAFLPVVNATLGASITINVPPGTLPGIYTGNLTVTNANNCSSSTPASFTVTVNPLPTITPDASAAPVCASAGAQTTTLGYTSTSSPATYSITWNSTPTNSFAAVTNAALGATPIIINVPAGTAPGTYTGNITVKNGNNCSSGSAVSFTVTVNPLPTATIGGTITVCQNSTPAPDITFTGANGTAPYTFTYTINTGAPQTVTTVSGNSVTVSQPTNTTGSYIYTLISVQDASSTTCSNIITGQTATVTVKEPVVIITQPQDETTCATYPVSFTAAATGDDLTYQWYKVGSPDVALSDNSNISGSQTNTLNFAQAATTDAGSYYVIVTGSAACGTGVQSTTVTLIVNQDIVINSQPAPLALCSGGTAVFTINATGTGISYRWRKGTTPLSDGIQPGGSVISGATTATLTITGVTTSDAANYNVVLTSPGGLCPGANSANAALVVNPIPTVNAVTNRIKCNGVTSGAINFTGAVAGTDYSWTNSDPSIGLAANGTGNIAPFITTNTSTAPLTATITVTPSYTNAGSPSATCTGTPTTFNFTVNPTATVNPVTDQTVCNGDPTAAVTFSSPTTGGTIVYNWTNNTPSIGLAANGSGNIASFTASNATTAPVTATITVTPSYTRGSATCTGTAQTFNITVNPTATVNAIADQIVCNGAATNAVNFSGGVAGTVYNWTNSDPSIGLAANGTGNIATFIATNNGTAPVIATITVTPTYASTTCTGAATTFTITVNPTATVATVPGQTVCDGGTTAAINFSSGTTGGSIVYNWTNNTPFIGLSASGNGNIPAFTVTNPGATPVTATITVTPSYTNGSTTCPGTPQTFTITVNPQVIVTPLAQTICNNGVINPIIVSATSTPGTITTWTRTTPAGITSTIPLSGTGPIAGTFTSTNTIATTVTFTINTLAVNGCTSTVTATVTIGAQLAPPVIVASQVLCGNSTPAPFTGTPASGGSGSYTYVWQQATVLTGPWTTAPGSTNALTYTPPAVTAFYRLMATDPAGCGSVYSDTVQIAKSNDIGGSFEESGKPTLPLCNGSSFTYNINSTSLFSIFSNYYVRYTWAASPAGFVSAPTPNQFGTNSTCYLFFIIPYDCFPGTKTFTVTNNTNAPVSTTINVTPKIFDGSNVLYCQLSSLPIPIIINPTAVVNTIADQVYCKGASVPANAFTSPTTGGTVTYSWTNSNTAIGLGASGNGNLPAFTATNTGTAPIAATITVTPKFTNASGGPTCNGTPTTFTITVNPNVTVNAVPNQNVCNNAPTAAVNFSSPTTVGTVTYNWTNSAPSIGLAASGTGNISSFTAINTGLVPITATIMVTPSYTDGSVVCPGTPSTFTITVNPTLTAGIISGTSPLCIGQTTTYTSTGIAGGTWSSSNTAVATVDPVTGVVTAAGTGTTNISYSFSSGCGAPVSAQKPLTVSPDASAGTISGTPTTTICIGATTTYASSGNAGGTWSSDNTAIATVDPTTGIITGVSDGTANITYTVNSGCNSPKSASLAITVSPDATAGTVSGISPVCIGTVTPYSVTGNSATGTWSSSNTSVATVDALGNVTAVAAGTADITYLVSSGCNAPVSSLKTITVGANANAGTITGNAQICLNASLQFLTTGDAGGVWSSSNSSIATVTAGGVVKGISAGAATITYTVTNGCGAPVHTDYPITVVSTGAVLNPGPISGPTGTLCANTPGLVYSVTTVTDATYYVWTVPAGWTITAGANPSTGVGTNSITVTTGNGGAGTITVTAGNACGLSPASSSLPVTVSSVRIWLGITMDWNNASNWCGGVPTATTDAIIPATGPGTYYLPQLTADAPVHDITIATGANIDLNGFNFTVNGAFSGTGTLSGSATSGLIIDGAAGTVYFKKGRPFNMLKTLTLGAGSSLTLGGSPAAGDTLNIVPGSLLTGYGTISVATGGTLNSNGIIDLNSSLLATARVDLSPGVISGNVTIERSIPPLRAWRFLSVPFSSSTQSINEAWQEGKTNPDLNCANNQYVAKGYGTEITSNGVNGYDPNITTNPSIKVWVNNTWAFLNSTTTGKITDYSAYCLFVRGDRTICLSQGTSAIPNATILRSTGILNQFGGTNAVNRTFTGVPVGNFLLIGNPYASAINLQNVITGSRVQGFQANKIWVWDPVLSAEGAYVTFTSGIWAPATGSYPAGSGLPPIIRNGQAFMVQTSSTNGSVQFQDNDKDADQANVFGFGPGAKPGHPAIFVNLVQKDSVTVLDGVAAGFAKKFSAAVDAADAQKQWNNDENLALIRDNKALAIELRPLPEKTDTLFFRLYLRQQPYRFKIFSQNLHGVAKRAWIVDKYLNTQTEINLFDTTLYSFTPNTDTNSYRNRFMLVFRPAKNRTVEEDRPKAFASIYPNPVSGKSFTLVLRNLNDDDYKVNNDGNYKMNNNGDYKVNIYNTAGNLVITRSIHYEGSKNEFNIKLPPRLASGSYIVRIVSDGGLVVSAIPLVIGK